MEKALQDANAEYKRFRTSHPNLSALAVWKKLEKENPDIVALMEVRPWVELVMRHQYPNNDLLDGLHKYQSLTHGSRYLQSEVLNQPGSAALTQSSYWPIFGDKQEISYCLRNLPKGVYKITARSASGAHALAIHIADTTATIFDLNLPEYFIQTSRETIHELSPPLISSCYPCANNIVTFRLCRIDRNTDDGIENNQAFDQTMKDTISNLTRSSKHQRSSASYHKPLMQMVYEEDIDLALAEELLKTGADPNITLEGIPLLVKVIQNKEYTLAGLLICYGADLSGSEWGEASPLSTAISTNDLPLIADLLEHQPDLTPLCDCKLPEWENLSIAPLSVKTLFIKHFLSLNDKKVARKYLKIVSNLSTMTEKQSYLQLLTDNIDAETAAFCRKEFTPDYQSASLKDIEDRKSPLYICLARASAEDKESYVEHLLALEDQALARQYLKVVASLSSITERDKYLQLLPNVATDSETERVCRIWFSLDYEGISLEVLKDHHSSVCREFAGASPYVRVKYVEYLLNIEDKEVARKHLHAIASPAITMDFSEFWTIRDLITPDTDPELASFIRSEFNPNGDIDDIIQVNEGKRQRWSKGPTNDRETLVRLHLRNYKARSESLMCLKILADITSAAEQRLFYDLLTEYPDSERRQYFRTFFQKGFREFTSSAFQEQTSRAWRDLSESSSAVKTEYVRYLLQMRNQKEARTCLKVVAQISSLAERQEYLKQFPEALEQETVALCQKLFNPALSEIFSDSMEDSPLSPRQKRGHANATIDNSISASASRKKSPLNVSDALLPLQKKAKKNPPN
ncbi:hypothetical protein [Endozoicomonas sp. OPT23]|uniref:hypothetical protein n=1 Tax=Endozoicomonas sp. OPT23 TaxID=2072845 RepID=UPI00129ABD13|nr:hypothetical protein [Endozoicomonas sp. OPT23]